MIKEAIQDFFTVSRKERAGTILLFLLLIGLLVLNQLSDIFAADAVTLDLKKEEAVRLWIAKQDSIEWSSQNRSFEKKHNRRKIAYTRTAKRKNVREKFLFDPNHATENELCRLGFSDFAIRNIIRFRTHHGVYRLKADLKKTYGVSEVFYNEIAPFISLPEQLISQSIPANVDQKPVYLIEINEADTTLLKSLHGIGSKLAGRIVSYRNKLGGFSSIDQLREIYGLSAETFEKIRNKVSCNAAYSRINLNTCTLEVLSAHPYVSEKKARGLINYRDKHGDFDAVEDILHTGLFDDESFRKIAPYLSVQ